MRQQSFTMAEAIVALMLMVLVVNLFGLVMGSYQKLAKIDASEPTNWYLFIDELESTEHRFELVKVTSNTVRSQENLVGCRKTRMIPLSF